MAISLVNTGVIGNSTGSAFNVTLPTGTIEGDVLIIMSLMYHPKTSDTWVLYTGSDPEMNLLYSAVGTTSAVSTSTVKIQCFRKTIKNIAVDVPGSKIYTFAHSDGISRNRAVHWSVWRGMDAANTVVYNEATENVWSDPLGPAAAPNGSLILSAFVNNAALAWTEQIAGTNFFSGQLGAGDMLYRYAFSSGSTTGRWYRDRDDIMTGLMMVFRPDASAPAWVSAPAYSIPSSVYLGDGGFYSSIGPIYDPGWAGTATNPSGIESVRYAVWTNQNGQDDLVWHYASKIGGNSYYWEIWIPFSSHFNESGDYLVHIYAFDFQGNNTALVATGLNVYDNLPPTLSVRDASGVYIANGQSISHGTIGDFLFKVTSSDPNLANTLSYSVTLRGATRTAYTSIIRDAMLDYMIPYNELVLGLNTVVVSVKDNIGAVTTLTFTIRVKTTTSLSLRSVYTTLRALGYSNLTYASLNAIKPSGYNRSTVSLSEIVGVLL